jgi:molybdenum cofactor cytidylyltransferase
MTTDKYAALVLAAGLSSRMNEFKPLLKVGNETITDRVISIFRDNGIEVFIVTGWRSEELIQGIKHRDTTVVFNPEYETGMFSSVRAGIAQLPEGIIGLFVTPVDMPLVRPATIRRLLLAAEENPHRIIYPTFAGRRGHPTYITSDLLGEILGWNKEGGLKAILDSHMELRFEIPVADTGILLDVDSPADYAALLERYRKYDNPAYSEINAMLDIAGTPNNVRRHCRKVAEIAVRICNALAESGFKIDVDIIRSAALLHDIARTTTNHDAAGSKLL